LQRLFGAAITRQLWRWRIVAALLGPTTSGKTTLLNILAKLFPSDQVGATGPQRWDSEYYRAALAGKALNIVGELDPHQPIPGGAFKSVVGQDVIEGRHPTHRPFSFVCQAAHFFNANKLPPTIDRSDAFFKRWRIVHFKHQVADDQIIPDLADIIFGEEIGPVLAWMLDGGVMVAMERGLPTTPEHDALIRKWRNANNSALQFVCDSEVCLLDPAAVTDGKPLFDRYQAWARDSGVKPFGRNGFYEALEEGGGRLGMTRYEEHRFTKFRGVQLI
jgi:putative DNA primase/helicase